jgi:hypothetical protein
MYPQSWRWRLDCEHTTRPSTLYRVKTQTTEKVKLDLNIWSVICNLWCVHNRLPNANVEDKFKWTPDISLVEPAQIFTNTMRPLRKKIPTVTFFIFLNVHQLDFDCHQTTKVKFGLKQKIKLQLGLNFLVFLKALYISSDLDFALLLLCERRLIKNVHYHIKLWGTISNLDVFLNFET